MRSSQRAETEQRSPLLPLRRGGVMGGNLIAAGLPSTATGFDMLQNLACLLSGTARADEAAPSSLTEDASLAVDASTIIGDTRLRSCAGFPDALVRHVHARGAPCLRRGRVPARHTVRTTSGWLDRARVVDAASLLRHWQPGRLARRRPVTSGLGSATARRGRQHRRCLESRRRLHGESIRRAVAAAVETTVRVPLAAALL